MWVKKKLNWNDHHRHVNENFWHKLRDNAGKMLCGVFIPPGSEVGGISREKPDNNSITTTICVLCEFEDRTGHSPQASCARCHVRISKGASLHRYCIDCAREIVRARLEELDREELANSQSIDG